MRRSRLNSKTTGSDRPFVDPSWQTSAAGYLQKTESLFAEEPFSTPSTRSGSRTCWRRPLVAKKAYVAKDMLCDVSRMALLSHSLSFLRCTHARLF
jgi:hypothetical protein